MNTAVPQLVDLEAACERALKEADDLQGRLKAKKTEVEQGNRREASLIRELDARVADTKNSKTFVGRSETFLKDRNKALAELEENSLAERLARAEKAALKLSEEAERDNANLEAAEAEEEETEDAGEGYSKIERLQQRSTASLTKLEDAVKEVNKLKADIANSQVLAAEQTKIAVAKAQVDTAQAKLDEDRSKISVYDQQVNAIRNELSTLVTKNRAGEEELKDLDQQLRTKIVEKSEAMKRRDEFKAAAARDQAAQMQATSAGAHASPSVPVAPPAVAVKPAAEVKVPEAPALTSVPPAKKSKLHVSRPRVVKPLASAGVSGEANGEKVVETAGASKADSPPPQQRWTRKRIVAAGRIAAALLLMVSAVAMVVVFGLPFRQPAEQQVTAQPAPAPSPRQDIKLGAATTEEIREVDAGTLHLSVTPTPVKVNAVLNLVLPWGVTVEQYQFPEDSLRPNDLGTDFRLAEHSSGLVYDEAEIVAQLQADVWDNTEAIGELTGRVDVIDKTLGEVQQGINDMSGKLDKLLLEPKAKNGEPEIPK